jgi:hypothetical protein
MFSVGYSSSGKVTGLTQGLSVRRIGQGDTVGVWVEYHKDKTVDLRFFINGDVAHEVLGVEMAHEPPIYFTVTLYRKGTTIRFINDLIQSTPAPV